MKRSEIIEEAKQLVLSSGPANILEFGSEFVADMSFKWSKDEQEAILTEAVKQAKRVYSFLGYVSPWGE